MNPSDIIAIVVIVLIIGAATAYIIKAKKSGKQCIGCPDSCSCHAKDGKSTCHSREGSGSCSSCSHCQGNKAE
ncbi:MAG: FeoB-associated Cys-rich membrane protein [Clostridia bacterium]|nr:FeoB-associated Cys-rich membrane protein [Clostridia bacterium]